MSDLQPDRPVSETPAVDITSLPEDLQQQFMQRLKERSNARASAARPDRRPRILVVEDNPDSAEMLETILQQMGYDTQAVSDGAHVVAAARAFAPDAVLMDINLPHRDGYTLAMDMHADEMLRYVPLVAITGFVSAEDRSRPLQAGFEQHMAKPVAPHALQTALQTVLRNRRDAPLPR